MVPAHARLPDPGQLRAVASAALAMPEIESTRRLVVVDDVAPVDEADDADIDDLLASVSSSLGVAVLAVLQYDINAVDFKTDSVFVLQGVVGQAAALRFAEDLIAAHPHLAGAKPWLSDIVRRHYRDLHRLCWALQQATSTGQDLLSDEQIEARLSELDEDQLYALARLAAVSLLNNGSHAKDLYPLGDKDFADFGAQYSDRSERWRLYDHGTCHRILRRHLVRKGIDPGSEVAVHREIANLSAAVFEETLVGGNDQPVAFLRNARYGNESACRRMLAESATLEPQFMSWLARIDVLTLAEFALAADSVLPQKLLGEVERCLLARAELLDSPTGGELLLVLRALHRFRHRAAEQDFEATLERVARVAEEVLRTSRGSARTLFRLVELLVRFHHDELNKVVAAVGSGALTDLDPNDVGDYGLVRRLSRLLKQAARASGETLLELEANGEVAKLVRHRPQPRRGAPIMLALVALRGELGKLSDNWDEVWREFGPGIVASLPHSDVGELKKALIDLHGYSPALCLHMLQNVAGLDTALRTLLERNAFAGEAAQLVGVLTHRHPRLASKVLYERSAPGVSAEAPPRKRLVEKFARRIKETGDNKGAGMLLRSTHVLDDWSGNPARGFSHHLAVALGFDWFQEQVVRDARVSVVGYLLSGLSKSRAPFRDKLLDKARESVVNAVRASLRPWGPQLALTIADDPDHGDKFVEKLRNEISAERLLEGMLRAGNPDSRTFFHRLGRTLYREIPTTYRDRYDQEDRILTKSPSSALQALVEAANTLRSAHIPSAGKDVLESALRSKPGKEMLDRLGRYTSPTELATSIRLLYRLDPDFARAKVDELMTPRRKSWDGHASVLRDRVLYALFNAPAAAADLMSAVEHAAPGQGARLLEQARSRKQAWNTFTDEVKYIQYPTQQWAIAYHLATVGLRRGQPQTDWMQHIYQARTKTLPRVRSPRLITETLQMFHLWDEEWFASAVERVDVPRLVSRLADGIPADLAAVPSLLSALEAAGAEEVARKISGVFTLLEPAAVVRRVGLRQASRLVMWLSDHGAAEAEDLAVELARSTSSRLARTTIRDEAVHWTEIGWAAAALHRVGAAQHLSEVDPAVGPNLAFPAECAWGVARLPQQRWTRTALSTALDKLAAGHGPADATTAFHTLAAASVAGRTADFIREPQQWSEVSKVSMGQLRELQRLADSDPVLKAFLRERSDDFARHLTDGPSHDYRVEETLSWFDGAVDEAS